MALKLTPEEAQQGTDRELAQIMASQQLSINLPKNISITQSEIKAVFYDENKKDGRLIDETKDRWINLINSKKDAFNSSSIASTISGFENYWRDYQNSCDTYFATRAAERFKNGDLKGAEESVAEYKKRREMGISAMSEEQFASMFKAAGGNSDWLSKQLSFAPNVNTANKSTSYAPKSNATYQLNQLSEQIKQYIASITAKRNLDEEMDKLSKEESK